MADGKCLANRLCNAMGGPTALAMYDGPAAVRDAVSSALANMQPDATARCRVLRNELTDVERHAVRTVINRATVVRSRARQRRELPHLRDQLRVKEERLEQIEAAFVELAALRFERQEAVLNELTASIKRLLADFAELTASVKRLETACPNSAGAPQSVPFSPVPARVPHPLPDAAGAGGTAWSPVAPSPASHAPLLVLTHDFASAAPQPHAAAGRNADALAISPGNSLDFDVHGSWTDHLFSPRS